MSAYCSPDDIEPVIPRDRLASLVGIDNAGSGGSEYTGAVQRYITMASNEIESVLGSLYTVPIPLTATQSWTILKGICAILTAGYIYQMNSPASLTEAMQGLVDQHRQLLRIYGDGGMIVHGRWVAKGLPDAPGQNVGPAIVAPEPIGPYTENIALATLGAPTSIEVNT